MTPALQEPVLSADGVSPGLRSYCRALVGDPQSYDEFIGLLNAGVANVSTLNASGVWLHGQNADINAADPYALRYGYFRNGRFDNASIECDIAHISAELNQLKSLNSPSPKVQRQIEAWTERLEQLQQYRKWAFGLCREWAESNFIALTALQPKYYTIEWVELMTLFMGMNTGEHNVLRISERGNAQQAFVFDSWKRPTKIATWAEFFHGYRFMATTRRYPK